jgi:hypothetical protein
LVPGRVVPSSSSTTIAPTATTTTGPSSSPPIQVQPAQGSPTGRSGITPWNPLAPGSWLPAAVAPVGGVTIGNVQAPPGGIAISSLDTPLTPGGGGGVDQRQALPSALSTFLPPPPRSAISSSASAPFGLVRSAAPVVTSLPSTTTPSTPTLAIGTGGGVVPSTSTSSQPLASPRPGMITTRTYSGGPLSPPMNGPPSPAVMSAKRPSTPPPTHENTAATSSLSSNPSAPGGPATAAAVPVPMTPGGTGLATAPLGFPAMTTSSSAGSAPVGGGVGSGSGLHFDYSPPEVNLNPWYVACDLEPPRPEGNLHVACAWLPEQGHTDPTANPLINGNPSLSIVTPSVDRLLTHTCVLCYG